MADRPLMSVRPVLGSPGFPPHFFVVEAYILRAADAARSDSVGRVRRRRTEGGGERGDDGSAQRALPERDEDESARRGDTASICRANAMHRVNFWWSNFLTKMNMVLGSNFPQISDTLCVQLITSQTVERA